MIMAHAPVILPAVLRRPLPYHPAMIAPAALLHGSLALRLWAATPTEPTSPGRSAASSTSSRCCCSSAWRPGRRVRAAHAGRVCRHEEAGSGRCATSRRRSGWSRRVVVALVHPFVAAPGWLMIHLLLLGAVTHSIVVWSNHFAETLLHAPTGPDERRRQSWRLLLLNGGVLLVVVGVPSRGLGADPGRGLPRRRGRRLARRLAGPPAAPVAALPVPAAGALLRRRRGVPPGRRRARARPWPAGSPTRCTTASCWRTSRSTCSAGWG